MGNESQCHCTWNGTSTPAKALLESKELILRGEVRRRIPFDQMSDVHATGCELSFSMGRDAMTLRFPRAIAEAWAKRILSPPVSLASKLGLHENSAILLHGSATSTELQAAVRTGHAASWSGCELAIAEVTTVPQLNALLQSAASECEGRVPLWIVYQKGAHQEVGETLIRRTARAEGWVDNKVASVSPVWTALRFIRTDALP